MGFRRLVRRIFFDDVHMVFMLLGFLGFICSPLAELLFDVNSFYVTTPSLVIFILGWWLRAYDPEKEQGAGDKHDGAD